MEHIMDNEVSETPWYFKGATDYIDTWFLMGSPVPILAICLAYLAFVLKLGPALMEKLPAFQLRTPIIIYNLLQVLFSFYVFWNGAWALYDYGLVTRECVMEDEAAKKLVTGIIHTYLVAKVSELLDTVFFVLRKKNKQVTFLHVYHHSMMMIVTWGALKYDPTYGIFFIGIFNSLVHVIMYSYYGLSAFPSLEKYLWWKKYITLFQLIQFVIMIVQVVLYTCISKCRPTYFLQVVVLFNLTLMIYLFRDFYFKSYTKQESVVVNDKSAESSGKHGMLQNGKSKVDLKNGVPNRKLKSKGE